MEKETKKLLEKYGLRPKKRLGQNFLISSKVLTKIVKASRLKRNDVVLEIGPGLGTLTKELAKRAKKVIAVEKDERMAVALKQDLKGFDNIEIVGGDILKINFQFSKNGYKLLANLPYYITAPVIRKFLESSNPPKLMVLMVQKEVAKRICEKPPRMSKVAVFCQFYGTPKVVSFVRKSAFWPQPKVDSAILKITPEKVPNKSARSRQFVRDFEKVVNVGFSQPRKQLLNNLSKKLNLPRENVSKWLQKNNINPKQRAESLTIKDWVNLTKSFKF